MIPSNDNHLMTMNTERRNQLLGKFAWEMSQQNGLSGEIIILDDWRTKHLVPVIIPQIKGLEGAPISCRFLVHKMATDSLVAAFKAIELEGLTDKLIEWGGCYCPRMVRGSTSALSAHSWGAAFDLNQSFNGIGKEPLPVGVHGSVAELVPIFADFGWFWGGWHQHRKDGMHFEYCGPAMKGA